MKESICVALLAHEGFIYSPVGTSGKEPPTLTQEVILHFCPSLDKLSIYRVFFFFFFRWGGGMVKLEDKH